MTKKTAPLNFSAAAPVAPADSAAAAPAASPAPIAQPAPVAPRAPRVALPASSPRSAPVPAEPKQSKPRRVIESAKLATPVAKEEAPRECYYWIGIKDSSPLGVVHVGAIAFCKRTEKVEYLDSLGKTRRTELRGEVLPLSDARVERIAEALARSFVRVTPHPDQSFGATGDDLRLLADVIEVPKPGAREETIKNWRS